MRPEIERAISLGFFVFPLHAHDLGICACGTRGCPGAGKHPLYPKGVKTPERWSATNSLEIASEIIGENHGWGIATEESGIVVLDLDDMDAINWWHVLQGKNEEIRTFTVKTSKGIHLYFRGSGVASTASVIRQDVDTRGDGGYVVGWGNRHRSGKKYEILLDAPIADLPDWLKGILPKKRVTVPVAKKDLTASSWHVEEAKKTLYFFVNEIENTIFPGPIHDLLNRAAFRIGQFAAAGALDVDFAKYELIEALDKRDPRGIYRDKNVAKIEKAFTEAESAPDLPYDKGKRITAPEIKRMARRAPEAVRETLNSALAGEAIDREGLIAAARYIAAIKPGLDTQSLNEFFELSVSMALRKNKEFIDPLTAGSEYEAHVVAPSEYESRLVMTDNGPRETVGNIYEILKGHEYTRGDFRKNMYDDRIYSKKYGRVDTGVLVKIAAWMGPATGLSPRTSMIREAIETIAVENEYNPITEYLESVVWDGVPRIDTWLSKYAGAEDTEYVRLVGVCWLLSAVARAFEPGCQVDNMLILEGDQGIGKSRLIAALCEPEYLLTGASYRKMHEKLRGKWLVELAECDQHIASRNASEFKDFLSNRVDSYRPAYGHDVRDYPRVCVFAGTTNQKEYLVDSTGNRRFWIVAAGTCAPDEARLDRDQIWAEAVKKYREGAPRWIPETVMKKSVLDAVVNEKMIEDPWEEHVERLLAGREGEIRIGDLLTELGVEKQNQGKREQMRLAAIMRALGWEKKHTMKGKHWTK